MVVVVGTVVVVVVGQPIGHCIMHCGHRHASSGGHSGIPPLVHDALTGIPVIKLLRQSSWQEMSPAQAAPST